MNSEPIHGEAETIILEKLGIPENDLHSIVGTAATNFWEIIVEKFHIDEEPAELVKEQFDYVAQQIEEQKCLQIAGYWKCWNGQNQEI